MEQLKCQTCGALFTPRTSGGKPQKSCSRRCTDKAALARAVERRAALRSTTCAECGATFTQEHLGRPRRYCSDKCKQRVGNRAQNRRRLPAPKACERNCKYCSNRFAPKRRDQVYCSSRCMTYASQLRRRQGEPARQGADFERQCVECGSAFTARKANAKWCSQICRIRTCRRDESRRRTPGSGAALYTDREIFERDGWRCHLCRKKVRPSVSRRDPQGATIDHIVPLSQGGADIPSNVATAHWRCNREKGARAVNDQLALL